MLHKPLVLLSLDVVPLCSANLEKVVKAVDVAFVLSVVGIPNLGKERICFCDVIVIPSLLRNVAFGAPVAAEKNEVREASNSAPQ